MNEGRSSDLASRSGGPYISTVSGELPTDRDADVAGAVLPPGRGIDGVFWISDGPVARVVDLIATLRGRYPETGLWPLVLQSEWSDPTRPWESREFRPSDPSGVDNVDVRAVLEDWWRETTEVDAEYCVSEEEWREAIAEVQETVAPFGAEFPGFAAASHASTKRSAATRPVIGEVAGRLGLVAVRRPADALAVLGLPRLGSSRRHPLQLSAIVRSWEERFGAVVASVGADRLILEVRRPPLTEAAARAVAAEHYAVCGDLLDVYRPLVRYASDLVSASVWSFWWD